METLINKVFEDMVPCHVRQPEEVKALFKRHLIKRIKSELKSQNNQNAIEAMRLYKRVTKKGCLIAYNMSPFDLAILKNCGNYYDIISYSKMLKVMEDAINGVSYTVK